MNDPPSTHFQYVILHHTGIPNPHFDLLLDPGGGGNDHPLWTWRLPTHPDTWPTTLPPATRLPDHRRLYLTYEGEISNHRGTVTRIATGTATLLHQSTHHLTLRLQLETTPITLTLPTTET